MMGRSMGPHLTCRHSHDCIYMFSHTDGLRSRCRGPYHTALALLHTLSFVWQGLNVPTCLANQVGLVPCPVAARLPTMPSLAPGLLLVTGIVVGFSQCRRERDALNLLLIIACFWQNIHVCRLSWDVHQMLLIMAPVRRDCSPRLTVVRCSQSGADHGTLWKIVRIWT